MEVYPFYHFGNFGVIQTTTEIQNARSTNLWDLILQKELFM